MSDPRGSGFDPYAYLHDTDEHIASYLPPEAAEAAEESAGSKPAAPPTPARRPVVARREPGVRPGGEAAAGPTVPAPAAPEPTSTVDLDGQLPATMTRRQLREARARASAQPGGAQQSAERSGSTVAIAAAATDATVTLDRVTDATTGDATATGSVPATPSTTGRVTARSIPVDVFAPVPSGDDADGATPASPRRRLLVLLGIVVGIAALAALVVLVVLPLFRGDTTEAPTAPPTASGGTSDGRTSALLELLPTTVIGGEFAAPTDEPTDAPTDESTPTEATDEPTDGASDAEVPAGRTYTILQGGYVANPAPPDGALESVVGQFGGGVEPVTLTASRFGTPDEALAVATAKASGLGTAVEEGVVFPDENRGYYWIFNTDGLVTIVWTDGDLGAYWVVSEDAASALDFYTGLEF
ncbi:hypothetical protein EDD28_0236 [Salana multivorans]|uniref:Uncharacterized protein n=1 Tax=Salana multivorans TaxID=120377 RepID=A0A3N2D7E1_9MICO|nr:hypothetical protein [Salana multivorans]ROR95675.1 hypothetical protein EDD28_0236 [Salana multivorans]